MTGLADGAAPDPDKDTFTVKKISTTAENALLQLTRSSQKNCIIEDSARQACKTMVSIEGKEVTLRELIEMVSAQAGVVAHWQDDSVVISLAQ